MEELCLGWSNVVAWAEPNGPLSASEPRWKVLGPAGARETHGMASRCSKAARPTMASVVVLRAGERTQRSPSAVVFSEYLHKARPQYSVTCSDGGRGPEGYMRSTGGVPIVTAKSNITTKSFLPERAEM